jgi:outer membrane protein insertion porin family
MRASRRARCAAVLASALAAWTVGAAEKAPSPAVLTAVVVEGNVRVEEDAIRVNLQSRGGQPLDEATVDQDVRATYAMGFFHQVTASVAETDSGLVLRLHVSERPLVRSVEVEGTDKIEEEDVEAALRVRPHTILDPAKMNEGIAAARRLYADKGYLDATISVLTESAPENEVDVRYVVDEGKPVRVRTIRIEGNEAFSDRKLRGLMQTKKRWLASRITGAGNLNTDVLKTDAERLTAWYYDHGYVTVRIDEPRVDRDDDGLVVTIKVSEGEQFTVGAVDVTGAGPGGLEALDVELETVSGEVFRASALRDDVKTLVERLSEDGYAFAKIEPRTEVDVAGTAVDVTFEAARGEPVIVDRIEITGNSKTRDGVVRREMRLQEQELFSGSKLRKSRNALQRLGFFKEVNVSTRRGDDADRLDVVVDVSEGQTGAFSAGAGFSSADSLLFNVQIRENNLFGRGQRVVANVDIGSIRRNIVLSFTEPYFLRTPLILGVDGFNWQIDFDGFERSGTGAGVSLTYPVTAFGWDTLWGMSLEEVRLGIGYRFEEAEIGNIDQDATASIKAEEGTSYVSSLTPRITRNTLNHAFDPTAGSVQDLSVELAGLGGEEFIKAELRNRFYYTFLRSKRFGDFTYSLGTTVGYGIGDAGVDGDELPLFERYFPGGINSIRGYEARSLGPREAKRNRFGRVEFTNPVGGSVLLVANNEVIFPLARSIGLKGVVFMDAGNAYRSIDEVDTDRTRYAVGAGVRWLSPLGPLRIELGLPFNDKPDDETSFVLFSFGGPFQF